MNAGPHILAIELGTSSIKVALIGENGWVAGRAARNVVTRRLAADGAEQDPEAIWVDIRAAVGEVMSAAAIGADAVVAVACDAQYSSVIAVDRDVRAVTPLLVWMDGRGGRYSLAIHERHPDAMGRWIEVHGIPPLPSGGDSLSKILWVKNERPEAWEQARAFLEPADWLVARLTGRFTATAGSAFMMLLTDNREPDAARWDEGFLAISEIDPEKLPELVRTGSIVGTLRREAAQELGLGTGTKVLAAVNDTHAASIATATFRPGRGAANVGTTGQVLAHVDTKKVDLENTLFSMPGPLPGRYVVMAENGVAARALEHFLREIVFATDPLSGSASPDPFPRLEATVCSAPAGAGGVVFLPWLTGTVSPDANANARGAFVNLSLATDRARMVRAILEGVAFSQRWLLPGVERFVESTFADLRFSGGGARSDEWARIFADVMDRPVLPLADPLHSNNRAAALLGFAALGLVGLDESIDGFCPVRATFEPRSENRALYDDLFAQFRAAYEGLRPVFDALNQK